MNADSLEARRRFRIGFAALATMAPAAIGCALVARHLHSGAAFRNCAWTTFDPQADNLSSRSEISSHAEASYFATIAQVREISGRSAQGRGIIMNHVRAPERIKSSRTSDSIWKSRGFPALPVCSTSGILGNFLYSKTGLLRDRDHACGSQIVRVSTCRIEGGPG